MVKLRVQTTGLGPRSHEQAQRKMAGKENCIQLEKNHVQNVLHVLNMLSNSKIIHLPPSPSTVPEFTTGGGGATFHKIPKANMLQISRSTRIHKIFHLKPHEISRSKNNIQEPQLLQQKLNDEYLESKPQRLGFCFISTSSTWW